MPGGTLVPPGWASQVHGPVCSHGALESLCQVPLPRADPHSHVLCSVLQPVSHRGFTVPILHLAIELEKKQTPSLDDEGLEFHHMDSYKICPGKAQRKAVQSHCTATPILPHAKKSHPGATGWGNVSICPLRLPAARTLCIPWLGLDTCLTWAG